MKTLIVYYSQSGHTDYAARKIAGELDADLLRLVPATAYPEKGFSRFFWGGKSAVMAETPELVPYTANPAEADLVVFGFPVWAGNVTPPLRTFIRDQYPSLENRKIAAFACQSGAGAEKAFRKLEECLRGEKLAEKLVLVDPKDGQMEAWLPEIRKFCDALKETEEKP